MLFASLRIDMETSNSIDLVPMLLKGELKEERNNKAPKWGFCFIYAALIEALVRMVVVVFVLHPLCQQSNLQTNQLLHDQI
jgi:hypothetical protein